MHMIKIYVIEDGGLTPEEKSYLEKLCSVQRGECIQFLKNIQTQLQLPEHHISQKVRTLWNSACYMLERFLVQYHAGSTVLPDTTYSAEFTIAQWNIVNQLALLLCPFEEFSYEVSMKID